MTDFAIARLALFLCRMICHLHCCSSEQNTLSDETVFALHGYCEKHVLGTKDKLKVSLLVKSPTEHASGNGGGTRQKGVGNDKPAKPKRSHKKKPAPAAAGPAPAARGPPAMLGASQADLMRAEAESAAAAALQREEVIEPLFGDEQPPIEGLGGEDLFGPLGMDGIADVPISTEMFGGPGV